MIKLVLVALGGGLGASARYLTGIAATRVFGHGFPFGTLTVNIVGSLLMGVLIGWLARRGMGQSQLQVFLATGLLGGFTTFSAFSLDAVTLWERGEGSLALAYVLASVVFSILALFGGLMIMRGIA